ncbi:MAG: NAD(P)/FAD-dependent oxidoreductase [Phycisphaerae bacterium]
MAQRKRTARSSSGSEPAGRQAGGSPPGRAESGAGPAKVRSPVDSDVLVIGAGAAGSTVAGLLAAEQRRVVLLDRDSTEGRKPMPRWVSGLAERILKKLKISPKKAGVEAVRAVAFHSADLTKHQEVPCEEHGAYFVDLNGWNAALIAAAVASGATFTPHAAVTLLRLKEDHVAAECSDGASRTAHLLVLADGVYSQAAESIGLQLRPAAPRRFAAQLEWPAGKPSRLAPGTLNFVLGIEGGKALATYWSAGDREVATVFATDEAAARAHLDGLLRNLTDVQGVALPRGTSAASAATHTLPVGHCLEIECHVGKRSLAIGDAGGFIASATCEGIYPAMWSAEIAAEIIHRALDRPHPQDELREFDVKWRTTMADYLRPPNADLQFLLPLVFANRQMAERLARAFLRGENL